MSTGDHLQDDLLHEGDQQTVTSNRHAAFLTLDGNSLQYADVDAVSIVPVTLALLPTVAREAAVANGSCAAIEPVDDLLIDPPNDVFFESLSNGCVCVPAV